MSSRRNASGTVLLMAALAGVAWAADEPKDMTAVVAAWNIKAMPRPISSARVPLTARFDVAAADDD